MPFHRNSYDANVLTTRFAVEPVAGGIAGLPFSLTCSLATHLCSVHRPPSGAPDRAADRTQCEERGNLLPNIRFLAWEPTAKAR